MTPAHKPSQVAGRHWFSCFFVARTASLRMQSGQGKEATRLPGCQPGSSPKQLEPRSPSSGRDAPSDENAWSWCGNIIRGRGTTPDRRGQAGLGQAGPGQARPGQAWPGLGPGLGPSGRRSRACTWPAAFSRAFCTRRCSGADSPYQDVPTRTRSIRSSCPMVCCHACETHPETQRSIM